MEGIRQKLLRSESENHPLIGAIRNVCGLINQAQNRFEQETDPDLVEAAIYELQSLRAQYRYLLRIAREQGVTCQERAHLWNE